MLWAVEGESLLPIDMESKNSMVDVARNKAAIDYCKRPLSVSVSGLQSAGTSQRMFYRAPGRGANGPASARLPRVPGKEAVAVHLFRKHPRRHACAGSAGVGAPAKCKRFPPHQCPHACGTGGLTLPFLLYVSQAVRQLTTLTTVSSASIR